MPRSSVTSALNQGESSLFSVFPSLEPLILLRSCLLHQNFLNPLPSPFFVSSKNSAIMLPNRFPVLACVAGFFFHGQLTTTGVSAFSPSSLPRFSAFQPLNLFADRDENEVRRKLEFKDLEPLEETKARRQRLDRETERLARFEQFGDNLWDLRSEMQKLSHELISAIRRGEGHIEEKTREILRNYESRDPELAYALAVAELEQAEKIGRSSEQMEELKAKTEAARSCLPQFNLEGLWVGKYGSSYDLINITYVGDVMIAEKVTGADSNVPTGAISFQADLNPLKQGNIFRQSDEDSLQPIILTEKASKKWGTKKLPRYSGLGQVAETGYTNNQWMDGQLIIIGDEYFSFAWLPIEQQIFFGRPSPELALKLLRDNGISTVPKRFANPPSLDADLDLQKEFLTRCLEATHEHEDEVDGYAEEESHFE